MPRLENHEGGGLSKILWIWARLTSCIDFKFELVRDNFTIFNTSVSVEQACFANERFQPEDSAKVIANMIRYECAISLRQISCCKCVRQTTTKGTWPRYLGSWVKYLVTGDRISGQADSHLAVFNVTNLLFFTFARLWSHLHSFLQSIIEVFLTCFAGYILARHGVLDKKTQKARWEVKRFILKKDGNIKALWVLCKVCWSFFFHETGISTFISGRRVLYPRVEIFIKSILTVYNFHWPRLCSVLFWAWTPRRL